ncbi:uncharacterized protein B0I36DRAFT_407647 [Microdochium trichocladiopsis]|uniref:Ferric reductase NAD binding domain-containing protein n=1 Tax=Microdochium trichocladiopsis TaxID=1682393 RepID=A0A9P8YBG6_9PEZI|nr:uncharacterized protein B0I36DRAFT_407647 [Microdochium trichocladiopsis]KAH7033053.1 hypothetical protein B0I36DRAFT_407647 [Microdochium trichocladiopsis]
MLLLVTLTLSPVLWVLGWRKSFAYSHVCLASATLGIVLWHVLEQKGVLSVAFVIGASMLLLVATVVKLLLRFRLRSMYGSSVGTSFSFPGATRLEVGLKRPIEPYAGMYYYLHFPGLRHHLHGFPMMLSSWDTSNKTMDTTKLHFIFHTRPPLPLASEERGITEATLAGPYGVSIPLHRYENVLLVGEGIGITGILPLATLLSQRRQHDDTMKAMKGVPLHRDLTRVVNLLWKVESAAEQRWCEDLLLALEKFDAPKPLIHINIILERNAPQVINFAHTSRNSVRRGDTEASVTKRLKDLKLKPGRTVVIVCGNREFSKEVRRATIDTRVLTDYFETEYQPRSDMSHAMDGVEAREVPRGGRSEMRGVTAQTHTTGRQVWTQTKKKLSRAMDAVGASSSSEIIVMQERIEQPRGVRESPVVPTRLTRPRRPEGGRMF